MRRRPFELCCVKATLPLNLLQLPVAIHASLRVACAASAVLAHCCADLDVLLVASESAQESGSAELSGLERELTAKGLHPPRSHCRGFFPSVPCLRAQGIALACFPLRYQPGRPAYAPPPCRL